MILNNISTIRAAAMAEECTDQTSAATSSSPPNWWLNSDHHHHHVHASTNSLSSWSTHNNNTNPNNWSHPQNPNYSNNSSGEEDVSMSTSFTNASNHSGLTVDSSRRLAENVSNNELIGETPSDNHIWNHVLLNVGNNGVHNNQDVGDNLINSFSAKNLSTGLYEPACDYLKKMDNGWEFSSSNSFNNYEKNFNGFNTDHNIFETERLSKLSNLVSNWSLAPPDQEVNGQFDARSCNISLSPTLDQYSQSGLCNYMKPSVHRKPGSYLTHEHDMKLENEQREDEVHGNMVRRNFNGSGIGYDIGTNNAMIGDNSKFYNTTPDVSCNNGRNFADVLTFSNCLSNKSPMKFSNASKPIFKSLNLSDCKKQALLNNSYTHTISTCNTLTRGNRKGQLLANEGKKKRCEDNSDTVLKKAKHENSVNVSSAKVQVPKAKLGDKITALQQIVSPFGKTDTASVLWEAIGYIKFLQEQVQLLSNPYMKTNAITDPWGGVERKDRGGVDGKLPDLTSRGLCLVPISCTPQVYRENTGPDYLTPAYRGCLYR